MRTIAEHQARLVEVLAPLAIRPAENLSIDDALSRGLVGERAAVLAEDVFSPIDHPPFDNSQMDGYAVRSAEVRLGVAFPIAGPIAAGAAIGSLVPGTAAPIMTGAPIPAGADAVIPIEASIPDHFVALRASGARGDSDTDVSFSGEVTPGAFVRPRGSDLRAGEVLLRAGTRLGPAQWGVAAASGLRSLPVVRPLRVLIVSTGDELTAPGDQLREGQIFDANGLALALAVAGTGAEVIETTVFADDVAALTAYLAANAADLDLVVTSGGVSAGAYEVVREALEPAGVVFDSVAMQPGGPQGLGTATLSREGDGTAGTAERTGTIGTAQRASTSDGTSASDGTGTSDPGAVVIPVVAFPGNPVSALVSFEVFLRPLLRQLHGLPGARPAGRAALAERLDSPVGRHQVRRGRLDARGNVELVGGPSSHLLHSYATSSLLVHIPVGTGSLAAGELVDYWRIDD